METNEATLQQRFEDFVRQAVVEGGAFRTDSEAPNPIPVDYVVFTVECEICEEYPEREPAFVAQTYYRGIPMFVYVLNPLENGAFEVTMGGCNIVDDVRESPVLVEALLGFLTSAKNNGGLVPIIAVD